jgi:DNA-binding Xre family transcriptional regulator
MDQKQYLREKQEKLKDAYPWWENIEKHRIRKGLKKKELAELIGVVPSTYTMMTAYGTFLIEIEILMKICKVS